MRCHRCILCTWERKSIKIQQQPKCLTTKCCPPCSEGIIITLKFQRKQKNLLLFLIDKSRIFSLYYSKEAAKNSMLYSYKHGFSGFAARLTESQAEEIAGVFKFLAAVCIGCFVFFQQLKLKKLPL